MRVENPNFSELLIGKSAKEVVEAIFKANHEIEKGGLILYHYQPGRPTPESTIINFYPNECLRPLIESKLVPGFDIGIFSKVELKDGSSAHLPLIDFEAQVCPENLIKIKERLARLPIEGRNTSWAILDSGNHYHAYCLNRLLRIEGAGERTILDFAERCHEILDFDNERRHDEIIHGWWFVHSAKRGGMTLRLTHNRKELKKKTPEVVAFVVSGDNY